MVQHEIPFTRNAHVKYESPIPSCKEAMAKVKNFFQRRSNFQGQGHNSLYGVNVESMDRQTGQPEWQHSKECMCPLCNIAQYVTVKKV